MRFLQNLAWGRESEVRTLMASFIVVALKMWVYSPKIAINNNSRYKFAIRKNSEGRQKKLNICTTTNLLLCNETIIVLKITLLHSVSVITNFVVPKRDKHTKNITLFRLTVSSITILGLVIEEVRPIFAPLTFLIQSVVSPLRAIKNLRENAHTAGKCLYLGCLSPESDQSKNLKATYRRVQTLRISYQELSYRQQIARQLGTQYAEGIYRLKKYYTVTLKSRLRVTPGHWKRNHWIDHTRLSSSRVI